MVFIAEGQEDWWPFGLITNPLGIKGLAELGLCGVAPALASAVWHATGSRVRELPITLDKVLG